MMKILATVAVLSLSMTGISLAQDSGSGGGSTDSSSGSNTTGQATGSTGDGGSAGTASGSGNGASSGGEAACPAGQKPADNYTTADPKCIAE